MPNDAEISITIDASLLEHFREKLNERGSVTQPAEAVTSLLVNILGNSVYPVTAKRTGKREISVGYRVRSFSQPIFQ